MTDGLVAALTARLVERVTDAEFDSHLRDEREAGHKNTRNGRTKRASEGRRRAEAVC